MRKHMFLCLIVLFLGAHDAVAQETPNDAQAEIPQEFQTLLAMPLPDGAEEIAERINEHYYRWSAHNIESVQFLLRDANRDEYIRSIVDIDGAIERAKDKSDIDLPVRIGKLIEEVTLVDVVVHYDVAKDYFNIGFVNEPKFDELGTETLLLALNKQMQNVLDDLKYMNLDFFEIYLPYVTNVVVGRDETITALKATGGNLAVSIQRPDGIEKTLMFDTSFCLIAMTLYDPLTDTSVKEMPAFETVDGTYLVTTITGEEDDYTAEFSIEYEPVDGVVLPSVINFNFVHKSGQTLPQGIMAHRTVRVKDVNVIRGKR